MEDNMKNFREASELILKNIYVTDELKRKTLEKCTDRKVSILLKPRLIATFSAALLVFLGIFIYYFHKPAITDNHIAKSVNQEYENSSHKENKIQEAPKITDSSDSNKSSSAASNSKDNTKNSVPVPQRNNVDIAMKDSNSIPKNKSMDEVNENTETAAEGRNNSSKTFDSVPEDRIDTSNANKSEINPAAQAHPSLTSVYEPLTVEKAEEYFEGNIMFPSYIPEGFNLTDISIPEDKEKSVKLEYSSGSAYFEILQSKSLSKLAETKNMSVENNTAYVNSVKDERTNIITTEITWIVDNVQYSLSGSLPEDSLIKIAKSIGGL